MTTNANTDAPNFESSLTELEAIVSQMESGNLPLAESIEAYKRGALLLQNCQKSLQDAEQQISMLNEANQLDSFTPKAD